MATELSNDCGRDEFYLYEGMTGVATINLLFGRAFNRQLSREEAQELYKTKAKYFVELGSPELMPGATKMLNVLKDNDIERVLVTGSGQKSVLDKIDCDYPGIFKETNKVTALDVINGKPNPEPYLKGLGLVGLKPNQAIVVENAPLGIKAGSAAGCFTIGITTGPIPEKEMWNSGANLVFPSMPAFADNIEIIIKNLK